MNASNVSATDLLNTARNTLIGGLLPTLSEEFHYDCRMIARAMSVAAREIELGAEVARIEANSLSEVLAQHGLVKLTAEHARHLLAGFIRNGVFDTQDAAQAKMLEALMLITRAHLAISNPKVVRDDR
ncbi:DUF6285 domain-containing protein [Pseudomonas aeruginosa]|nr:DUF6285 domain-containing protein [Pseudomonas aeruginosa]